MASLVAQRTGGIGNYDVQTALQRGPHGRDPETRRSRPTARWKICCRFPAWATCPSLRNSAGRAARSTSNSPSMPGALHGRAQGTLNLIAVSADLDYKLNGDRDDATPGTLVAERRSAGALARDG